ncbi:MAG TPA: hypothetical protein PKH39_10820 [Woeseiaceae bacterium]|nr:hypothetical protein [Woeseiaceae bacterium]
MQGRRNPFVAREGLPLLVATLASAVLLIRYSDPWLALAPTAVFIMLYFVFRDPKRVMPSVALGVVSPVDGEVLEVGSIEAGDTGLPALRVVIAVDSLGTYTARSPVEGIIKDMGSKAMWLQTDEGVDVTLKFRGHRLGLAPRAFGRFGERLGQGQRCAYLRLTRIAEVQWPDNGKVSVEIGQTVRAGIDLIGTVPSTR